MRWLLLLSLVLPACSGDDGGSTDGTSDGADGNEVKDFVFVAGEMQLFVHSVEDDCLDGSLQLVFMPNGTNEPYALQNKTYIPGEAELPADLVIKLNDPFSNMPVTYQSAGAYTYEIRDAFQSQVELNLPSGQCAADMNITADVTIDAPDAISLTASVSLTAFSSADDLCPEFDADICSVTLDMTGTR